MSLNPFFLQGSASEQRLVQDLINEQLKIYGVEVIYIPRKFVNKKTIMEEVQSSRFDDNFYLEAYVNSYDGYSGSGDILTKFGMSLRDELILTISRERFEDFIAPFLAGIDDGTEESEVTLSTRPREGDLVYFPLGERIFEVKFVEHEQPFYQLGKNYVYELKCELFEYENEIIDTTIQEVDTQIQKEGYITTLSLIGIGVTAQAVSLINTGYINKIYLNNDGYGYSSPPKVSISTSPTGNILHNATAVAIGAYKGRSFNLKDIYLVNAGIGYTVAPIITLSGGGGSGAAATCSIEKTLKGVIGFNVFDGGVGYGTAPVITVLHPSVGAAATATIGAGGTVTNLTLTNPGTGYTGVPSVSVSSPPTGIGTTATVTATISGIGEVSSLTITNPGSGYTVAPTIIISNQDSIKDSKLIRATGISSIGLVGSNMSVRSILISNPGIGYTIAPQVKIDNPEILTGYGNYKFNEVIFGSRSKTKARVKEWDASTKILKISYVGIGSTTKGFFVGESIIGTESKSIYSVKTFDQQDTFDKYNQNDEIEEEADFLIDFSESNPFGTY